MNILFLTEDFPPMTGGIANFLSELCKELSKRGHKINVLVNKIQGFENIDEQQSYKIFRYNPPKRFRSFVAGWYLIKNCIKQRPDIIFMGHVFATRGLPVLFIHWFLQIPYVVLIHAGHLPLADVSRINRIAVYSLLRYANLLVSNSKYTNSLLIERGFSKKKIEILYPGVDTDYFSPLKDNDEVKRVKKLYCGLNTCLIVNVARSVPKKNHRKLIEAISELIKKGKRVKCVVAGDGPERERLESLIQSKKLNNKITLVGNLEREQVRNLLRIADIVVLPSTIVDGHHESFGIVAIEASSCGKPVIVGSLGGQAEAVVHEKTGFVVNADNIAEIERAVNRLIENKSLAKELGDAGRKHAAEEFSWERVAAKAEKMLEVVISERE